MAWKDAVMNRCESVFIEPLLISHPNQDYMGGFFSSHVHTLSTFCKLCRCVAKGPDLEKRNPDDFSRGEGEGRLEVSGVFRTRERVLIRVSAAPPLYDVFTQKYCDCVQIVFVSK